MEQQKTIRNAHQAFAKFNTLHRNGRSQAHSIYVLVAQQDDLTMETVLDCKVYTRHPVMCKRRDMDNSADENSFCFSDEHGNAYDNWNSYLNENNLPRGIMVVPRNGVYEFDQVGNVLLDIYKTPEKRQTIRRFQQEYADMAMELFGSSDHEILYILTTQHDDKNWIGALDSTNFDSHVVFRKKSTTDEGEDHYTFSDDSNRLYESWTMYLQHNELPTGFMVVPRNGIYAFDECGNVLLDVYRTPARHIAMPSKPTLVAKEMQQQFAINDMATKSNSQSSVIYILVTEENNSVDSALESTKYTIHKITRKTLYNMGRESENVNRYVDENDVTYADWCSFLSRNRLPSGIMIAPNNGFYSLDENGRVELKVCLTPVYIVEKVASAKTVGRRQQVYAEIAQFNQSDNIHILVTRNTNRRRAIDETEFDDYVVIRSLSVDGNDDNNDAFQFTDHENHTYSSWSEYLSENTLPRGLMVVPQNGVYTLDEVDEVQLQLRLTPLAAAERNKRTIRDVQQDFAETLGHNTEIIWDVLPADKGYILKNKINEHLPDQEKGQSKIEEMRKAIFDNVWAQRKYTNRNSLTAIIYVLVTQCEDMAEAPKADTFSCHPVFRTRKCVADNDSSQCCMVFVDERGRVYQNWAAYLDKNELPAGKMVAPRNGVYSFDDGYNVKLEVHQTPEDRLTTKVMKITDLTSTFAGLGAATVPLAAMVLPVAAPLVAAAGAVCLTTAAYSTVRSACSLVDRAQHDQSMSIANSEARNCYIGVGAGVAGATASLATRTMTAAAAAGKEVSLATELFVNGANITSIMFAGGGIANGIFDLFVKRNDGEEITTLDALQLATSLVLFTHSVCNYRLASTLVSETRQATVQDYRNNLSNRQKRMFDKISKETMRTQGTARGQIDILRNINEIPSKQYLNDLYKVNKQLNQQKIRFAFSSDGQGVVLNNDIKVDTGVLRNNLQHKVGPNVLNNVSNPIPATHADARVSTHGQILQGSRIIFDSQNANRKLEIGICIGAAALSTGSILLANGALIPLKKFGKKLLDAIGNTESFETIVTFMADYFHEETFMYLMQLAREFVERKLDELRIALKMFIAAESILFRMFIQCAEKYTDHSLEYLQTKRNEILKVIKDYFLSLSPNNRCGQQVKCEICHGLYIVTKM